MRVFFFAALSLALLLHGNASRGATPAISYGPAPQELLNVCAPSSGQTGLPAVLMIHGGGWTVGSRLGQLRTCDYLAGQGVVAIPVDYRLLTGTPDTTWPAQFNDVQLALRWVRFHAASYGIDPTHICAEGDSVGGELALLLGIVPGIDPGDTQGILSGVSPQADCVISISGPTDFIDWSAIHANVASRLMPSVDPAAVQAQEVEASPLRRLQHGAPPTLLIHGISDPQVPFSEAVSMRESLAAAGTPAWLITHDGGHELQGMTPQQAHKTWQMIISFVKTRSLPVPPGQLSIDDVIAAMN